MNSLWTVFVEQDGYNLKLGECVLFVYEQLAFVELDTTENMDGFAPVTYVQSALDKTVS